MKNTKEYEKGHRDGIIDAIGCMVLIATFVGLFLTAFI